MALKKVNTSIPAGTNPLPREVYEVVDRDPEYFTSYTSKDGETYTFRTHEPKGKPVAWRETLALLLCMREIGMGGSPNPVLDAFRLNIKDEDGKTVFPIGE